MPTHISEYQKKISEYQKKIQTIESEVYEFFYGFLSDNEKIELCCLESNHVFDFKLPQGISKLDYPSNTQIEVKYRLMRQSVSFILKHFDMVQPKKLVVVVYDGYELDHKQEMFENRNIEIISFDELKEKYKKDDVEKQNNKYLSEENIKEALKRRVEEKRLSIFLGAGVSASAGVPAWQALLECLCIKNGLPKMDSDIDEITKARDIIEICYKDKSNGTIKDSFYEDISNCLYKTLHDSELLESISKIVKDFNVESIITYNYDSLLEDKLNEKEKKCESIYDKTRTPLLPVYHVHGFIARDGQHSEIVLGEKEYHKIYQEAYNWGNVEQLHALCRNTCLFIGLSMKDPNLRRLIDISIDGSEVEPIHFVFLRRIEYNIPFMERTMRSFGINCVWYDNYSDLPKLLNDLCK
ncbi:MAG: hypothetical protein E7077_09520 [Bacteroidales bacterium]|jgi:hypothetical protein|nr:hypothetical protein [Bacteroidales bacterium]